MAPTLNVALAHDEGGRNVKTLRIYTGVCVGNEKLFITSKCLDTETFEISKIHQ